MPRLPGHKSLPFTPGFEFGQLTLLSRTTQPSFLGHPRRAWLVRCSCGLEFTELEFYLRRAGTVASCSTCREKSVSAARSAAWGSRVRAGIGQIGRQPPATTRPPAPHAGETHGHLLAIHWLPRIGWHCLCLRCGGVVTVRMSNQLGREGMRKGCDRCRPVGEMGCDACAEAREKAGWGRMEPCLLETATGPEDWLESPAVAVSASQDASD